MWKVEKEFSIRLGGNTYIDTPNLIVYQGTPIFRVRRNEDDGMLGIDFEVFDSMGQRVATFKKGIVAQGDQANYGIDTGHETYSVTERSSGRLIARVQRRGVQEAELDVQVHMYLPNRFLLDAGPLATNLGGAVIAGNVFKSCDAGIAIG
ncbi:hypothetical protein V8G57_15455 [Collimonas sp. H4R21]|uniref:Uncharacterized protein n=1 Tax=Collimonas rhizosphaerae TaxID=3126357 RepID=A0ABU9PXR3_9BURK